MASPELKFGNPTNLDPSVDEENDLDSAWGGDVHSETQSLTSSITNYRYENGRRYHGYKDGEYWGPNDEAQNDQLDVAHHCFLLLFDGKLFHAPIGSNPQEVLDVGIGTGIWAVDFADQYPSANVIGTDLSPTQPTWIPPNCAFEIEDCANEWTFQKDRFDFIHVRGLLGCLRDWPAFYKQVYKTLKPGGWYEQVEYAAEWEADDGSIPDGHAFQRASDLFVEAGERMGKTFRVLDQQKGNVSDAGLVNIVEKRYKMPLGPWCRDRKLKEVGRWHLLEAHLGIEGWAMALLTRIMGWSFDEVQAFVAEVKQGLKDRSIHAYTNVSVVYGQKPF